MGPVLIIACAVGVPLFAIMTLTESWPVGVVGMVVCIAALYAARE